MQAGHDVLLATSPDFASLAADYGIPFTKLGYALSFRAPDSQDATAAIEKCQTLKLVREAMKQRPAMAVQIN